MAGFRGRRRSAPSDPAVARRVFILQAVIVVLLVAAAVTALILQTRADVDRAAGNRSLAVAATFANAPGVEQALTGPDPSAVLQPRAEAARKASRVDFIVVMTTGGIRYTHPDPAQIGRHYIGTIAPAAAGGTVRETVTGTLGPSTRAVVPVTGPNGKAVGLVSAGITLRTVSGTAAAQLPLVFGAGAAALAVATLGTALIGRRLRHQTHGMGPAGMTRMYEHHDAVLHSVREGIMILDGHGAPALVNDEARRLLGLGPDAEGRPVRDLGLAPDIAQLLASGRTATDEVHLSGTRLVAISQRPTDRADGPPGSVATLRDTTELRALTGRAHVAQQRLKLLYDAGLEIGTTLDVVRTSQELADFAVPRFADFVTVDLADPVLRGDEPPEHGTSMRRTALRGVRDDAPFHGPDELIHFAPSTPQGLGYASGELVLDADMSAFSGWQDTDPERARRLVEYGIRSMIAAPLRARGVILGVVTFWRSRTEAFEQDDASIAEELVVRAAVSIDNARRFTREHAMAVALQRSLLPRALPAQNALDVAHRYLPARAGGGGVGGDWFDVIPLPGARVALVVGDVVGHGLHAAATMGRLRTAIHNFSSLDLAPDELLWHLDELVTQIDQAENTDDDIAPVTGATCLYAVYDPNSQLFAAARAGHVEPVIVHPDGRAEFIAVPGGPPLGLGGLPFETVETRLAEDTTVVLYTDGLVEDRTHDIGTGPELLRSVLAHAGRTPEETCAAVLDALLPDQPSDDIALLVARTRASDRRRTASWDVPSDPSAVGVVRAEATRTLAEWDLEEESFTTELILSELVTNAIRHAADPVRVRLIHDMSLICEVSDGSSTSPHLRRAATTDEGGRGLFLVARFADRWGTRYTEDGKVIWTEQPLPDSTPDSGGS